MNHKDRSWFKREGLALLTDLYELTMCAAQLGEKRAEQRVSFNYFFRSLPPENGFAITAGLEPFLDYLEQQLGVVSCNQNQHDRGSPVV